MAGNEKNASLSSRVIETKLVQWRDFQFIQQENLKEITEEEMQKLKSSILTNEFTQPFYVWQEPETAIIFCLDGKHRTVALQEIIDEGITVPDLLPATFIKCENKKEASRLVLIYSSFYASITHQGLFDFLQLYDISYPDIKSTMNLPELSMDRFEQKFNIFHLDDVEEPTAEFVADTLVQPGDVFEINGHRIACGSFQDTALLELLMQEEKARILNCDPPYNLPANFFLKDNKHVHNHKDFAMAAGEMTDEEFVAFLESIMATAVHHSVPGAIHYIFMDWRHVWHMGEAAGKVYGSKTPKQLCVWNKDLMANGSFYRSKHELCFIFSNEQAAALWNKDLLDHGGFYKDNNELVFIFKNGDDDVKHLSHLEMKDRIRTNVWNYPSATSIANPDRFALKNHPTPKPVQMVADAILDTSNPGDIVLDFFLGSGTCLIACEKTERKCRGTELEPGYIQLIIERYLRFCEKKGIEVIFTHLNGVLTINDFNYESINIK